MNDGVNASHRLPRRSVELTALSPQDEEKTLGKDRVQRRIWHGSVFTTLCIKLLYFFDGHQKLPWKCHHQK